MTCHDQSLGGESPNYYFACLWKERFWEQLMGENDSKCDFDSDAIR